MSYRICRLCWIDLDNWPLMAWLYMSMSLPVLYRCQVWQ